MPESFVVHDFRLYAKLFTESERRLSRNVDIDLTLCLRCGRCADAPTAIMGIERSMDMDGKPVAEFHFARLLPLSAVGSRLVSATVRYKGRRTCGVRFMPEAMHLVSDQSRRIFNSFRLSHNKTAIELQLEDADRVSPTEETDEQD